MQRLTAYMPTGDVAYIGKHTQLPGLEGAGTMRVAARRDVLQSLAAYEDTGLTPDEITALVRAARGAAEIAEAASA